MVNDVVGIYHSISFDWGLLKKKSSSTRTRTWNLTVNSRSLCQLSYRGRRRVLYGKGDKVSSKSGDLAGQSHSGRNVCYIVVCELTDPSARRVGRGVYRGKIDDFAKIFDFAIAQGYLEMIFAFPAAFAQSPLLT
jgi:hypothetical protein